MMLGREGLHAWSSALLGGPSVWVPAYMSHAEAIGISYDRPHTQAQNCQQNFGGKLSVQSNLGMLFGSP